MSELKLLFAYVCFVSMIVCPRSALRLMQHADMVQTLELIKSAIKYSKGNSIKARDLVGTASN